MSTFSYQKTLLVPVVILLFTLPFLFLAVHHILPPRRIPITLPDEIEDLSLFQRAIAAASGVTKPTSKHPSIRSHLGSTSSFRPKIAFLFLTNSDLYFLSLWERFFNQSDPTMYNIYIHADVSSTQFTPPTGVFANRTIPSRKTQRSSPTLVSAARRLLANALLDDSSNLYFSLISQHCIPLHSFNYLYSYLFDLAKLQQSLDYPSYIEISSDSPYLWDRYNARGSNVMTPEVEFEEFRVGSQFFTLARRHALMVIKDRKLWRKFKLPCLNVESCYPEEHYFPTLLSMADLKGCSRFTLTNVNWTDSVNGHPHTYHPPEVSAELIYRLRESNSTYSHMFSRKFSPDCLEPLMDLADSVIFKD